MKTYHIAIEYSHAGWPAVGKGRVQGVWYGYARATDHKAAIAKAVADLTAAKPMVQVVGTSAQRSGWSR